MVNKRQKMIHFARYLRKKSVPINFFALVVLALFCYLLLHVCLRMHALSNSQTQTPSLVLVVYQGKLNEWNTKLRMMVSTEKHYSCTMPSYCRLVYVYIYPYIEKKHFAPGKRGDHVVRVKCADSAIFMYSESYLFINAYNKSIQHIVVKRWHFYNPTRCTMRMNSVYYFC